MGGKEGKTEIRSVAAKRKRKRGRETWEGKRREGVITSGTMESTIGNVRKGEGKKGKA